jgi:hypothetical protein
VVFISSSGVICFEPSMSTVQESRVLKGF